LLFIGRKSIDTFSYNIQVDVAGKIPLKRYGTSKEVVEAISLCRTSPRLAGIKNVRHLLHRFLAITKFRVIRN
jgi:hypothetical protein